jgi:NNP family nitrate/nitrite transporter-like MFS transporter
MLEPLKNVQVWRFSLYYFFVFGGFVALALWLPRYLIGVYGLDITTAGMIGAAYSIPARCSRLRRALSDKYRRAARDVLDVPVSVALHLLRSVLSADALRREGHPGPISFTHGDGADPLHRARPSCSASS